MSLDINVNKHEKNGVNRRRQSATCLAAMVSAGVHPSQFTSIANVNLTPDQHKCPRSQDQNFQMIKSFAADDNKAR